MLAPEKTPVERIGKPLHRLTLTMSNARRGVAARLMTPQFVVALVLLGLGSALAGPFADYMAYKAVKLPLYLEAPLSEFDSAALAPYKVEVEDRQILDAVVIDALGTDQYIAWWLEDTSVAEGSPLRHAYLFVTYYTGGNDQVPHTPDVCYVGSGARLIQAENIVIDVASLSPGDVSVPVRVLTFVKGAVFGRAETTVIYTFYCNSEVMCSRIDIRLATNNIFHTYAYYSKIEISFPRADRAQSIEGAKKLLDVVLPVLIRDHYPDFERAERLGARNDEVGS